MPVSLWLAVLNHAFVVSRDVGHPPLFPELPPYSATGLTKLPRVIVLRYLAGFF